MSTLGENIAMLRKNKGLTQEKLAEIIGISAQSVSKWENDISMPDITLLPVLADIFSVSIDSLFGKSINSNFDRERLPENTINYILESIAGFFNISPDSADFEKYKAAIHDHNGIQTAYFTETNGAVLANENIGIVFRKNPREFAQKLPVLSKNCRDILQIIADPSVCAILSVMLTNPIHYSIAYLGKKCGLAVAEIESSLKKLESIGLLKKIEAASTEETVTVWRVDHTHKMLQIYTILTAAEMLKADEKYHCYCGSKIWCF